MNLNLLKFVIFLGLMSASLAAQESEVESFDKEGSEIRRENQILIDRISTLESRLDQIVNALVLGNHNQVEIKNSLENTLNTQDTNITQLRLDLDNISTGGLQSIKDGFSLSGKITFDNEISQDNNDPYSLEKITSGENSNSLRLTINDDGNEKFEIYGNSDSSGCPDVGCEAHFFKANGQAYHKGYLGVGTASPSQKLHVFSSDGNVRARIESNGTDPSKNPAAELELAGGDAEWHIFTRHDHKDLNFWSGGRTRFTLTDGGSVLVDGKEVVKSNGKVKKDAINHSCSWKDGPCGSGADRHNNIFLDRIAAECDANQVLAGIDINRCDGGMLFRVKCCSLGE